MRAIYLIVLFFAFASPASAQRIAFQPKLSTLGAGADVVLGISPHLNVRLGAQAFNKTEQLEESDIEYEGDAELRSANALLDLYPGATGFRISAGAVFNDNSFTGRSTEDTIIVINNVPYPVAAVGVITARVTTAQLTPYLGIGFGNPLAGGSRWRITLDVGAMYHGEPEVELTAVPIIPIPLPESFEEDLAAEEAELQEQVKDYKIFPVISLGVAYRF